MVKSIQTQLNAWDSKVVIFSSISLKNILSKNQRKKIILIAGGADKNLDYTPVGKPILDKVKTLILIGQTAGKIFNSVKQEEENQKKEIQIFMAKNLQEAIELAKKHAKQIVLFSPASTSFDMFKDMYDRGRIFKDLVNTMEWENKYYNNITFIWHFD